MIDPIYCSPLRLICQPLEWWSSAAAWAQAVLAALAIYAAASIPRRAERKKKLDSADDFLHYTKHLIGMIESLHESVSTRAGLLGISEWGHHAEWEAIETAAKELQLSALPSPDFLPPWLYIREMAARCSGLYRGVLAAGEEGDALYAEEKLEGYLYRTKTLFNDLLALDIRSRGDRGFSTYELY